MCFWIGWVCVYKYKKIKVLNLSEIALLPESKNVMNMAQHFNHHLKYTTCSSPDSFTYSESLQHPNS